MVPNRNTDVGENGEGAVSRDSGESWAPMLAPDNPYLLLSHAICAAAELPLRVMGRHNGPGTFPWQPESEEASAGSQCLRITPTTHYSTPRDVLTPRASLLLHELDTYLLLASTQYSMSPLSTALTLSICWRVGWVLVFFGTATASTAGASLDASLFGGVAALREVLGFHDSATATPESTAAAAATRRQLLAGSPLLSGAAEHGLAPFVWKGGGAPALASTFDTHTHTCTGTGTAVGQSQGTSPSKTQH